MLLNKVIALVTGASGGIGQAIARQLAEAGAKVVITGRNTERLNGSRSYLGDRCLVSYAGDLTQEQTQTALIEIAKRENVNVLINAMGVNQLGLLEEQDGSTVVNSLVTNLVTPLQITTKLLPQLTAGKSAQIVNIGSIFGSIGHPGYALYCAAKFGIRGFSEALGRELANSNVEVIYVAPRATHTNMNSSSAQALNKALGSQEDSPQFVAEQVLLSMQKGRTWTYLGWPEKLFVRINGLLPKLVDSAIIKQLPTIEKFAGASKAQCNRSSSIGNGSPQDLPTDTSPKQEKIS